jgi:hypothetical protein
MSPFLSKSKLNKIKNKTYNDSTVKLCVFKKIIVLLHGMNTPGDTSILDLKSKLNLDINDAEVIILDRENPAKVPMSQQAEEVYYALKGQMGERGLLANSPICIVGDS